MLTDVKLHLVETYEDVSDCLEWLSGLTCDRLGFDCETTGLSPETDSVRLVQFGDAFTGWAIELERWYGLVEEIVNRWQRRGRFVGHNARFDIAFLRRHGIHIPVHLVDDTMMLAHIVNPSVSIGLKQQCSMHIDSQAAAMQSQLNQVMTSGGFTWATIPICATGPCAVYWIYAALDPVLAVRLWEHHAPQVSREAPLAYDLELSTGWIADRMERHGVCVDRDYTEQQQTELSKMFDELTIEGTERFGINVGKPDQVVKTLLAEEVPLWKKTGEGAWSLDKQALAGIDHPLVRLVQRRGRIQKIGSTNLRRFLQYSEHDGRIHPSINTLGFSEQSADAFGVKTSRMSMSKPNLQQLPRVNKKDPLSVIVRNCIVSSPDHTFVFFDLDQIELRIMTHLTQDPGLLAAFLSDEDFFVALTRKVYQDPTSTKADPRRSDIKSYTYATNYGAGLDKLATTTGRPLAEMEKLDADFRLSYPGVHEFQRKIQQEGAQRLRDEGMAYVRSPLTNRKFIDTSEKLYPLVNYIIQGWAAEIMKTLLNELDAAGLGDYLALVVHDEAGADVPDDELSDAIVTMQDVMNNENMLSLPVTSGGATAKRWAMKSEL